MDDAKTQLSVRAVERALAILFCFEQNCLRMSLAELSKKTGLAKPTILRAIGSLEKFGMITKDAGSQKYQLGTSLLHLSRLALASCDFEQKAAPFLQQLSQATDETVNLNIMRNYRRVCIKQIESSQSIRFFVQPGEELPLHRGASGLTILAQLSEHEIMEWRKSLGPDEILSKTEWQELQTKIDKIKTEGFFVSSNLRVPGATAIAVPILDPQGNYGSINISGPSERFTPAKIEAITKDLLQVRQEFMLSMGYK